MEAASIPRPRKHRGPSAKALVAAAAYAGALLYLFSLVTDAREAAIPLAEAPSVGRAATPAGPSDLALQAVAARASRSLVTVAEATTGFVAWTYRGASLVLTAGELARGQELAVDRDGRSWVGEVIRVDEERDLALLRVEGSLGPPLWQERRPARVDGGEALVAVGESAVQLDVTRPRWETLDAGVKPGPALAGAPVLNGSGRLVAVATAERVIPIGRLCEDIRNC